MRAAVGFVSLQCLLAVAGLGVLRALGLVPAGLRSGLVAAGPAVLTGMSVVLVGLIALLVLGLPLTLATAALMAIAVALAGFGLARRTGVGTSAPQRVPVSPRWLIRLAVAAAGVFVLVGAYALAHAPTRGDDARIWSLKGLTLSYYDSLRPEIFHNALASFAHPAYPLFQPVLEAVLTRSIGQPDLRLFHVELWLLLCSAVWTVAYLIWWRRSRPLAEQAGLIVLAMLAFSAPVVSGVWSGYADVTGAVLLATGAIALGLWIDGASSAHLWLGAVLLGAAANTKDEETLAVALVVLAAAGVLVAGKERARLRLGLGGACVCAAMIAPWRIWTMTHHISDSVTPPLPRALSPGFVLGRLPQLDRAATALANHVLNDWGWLSAIFLSLCILSLASRTARKLTAFYLISFLAAVAALLWLYATTPLSLYFLIPTSMSRTVTVFMALTPFASAHLLTRLVSGPGRRSG